MNSRDAFYLFMSGSCAALLAWAIENGEPIHVSLAAGVLIFGLASWAAPSPPSKP